MAHNVISSFQTTVCKELISKLFSSPKSKKQKFQTVTNQVMSRCINIELLMPLDTIIECNADTEQEESKLLKYEFLHVM